MGCLSFAENLFFAGKFRKTFVLKLTSWGLVSLTILLLAETVNAAPRRQGLRAGSYFTGDADDSGQTNKRPYLRRQTPAYPADASYETGFDYRLSGEAPSENYEAYDRSGAESANDSVDRAGFRSSGNCDCGDVCGCGISSEPGCGCDDAFEPSCGCDEQRGFASCFGSRCRRSRSKWQLGVAMTFVKPRFSENVGLTTMTGDGSNNSVFTDAEFEYDLELSPRVWVEAPVSNCWSWRVNYWQFDHDPGERTASPAANGFGEITHPGFVDVDISTTIPADTLTASSTLNVFVIDAEALKQARLNGWQLGVGGGVRYASTEQSYFAQLRNTNNVLQGQIDFSHEFEGVGPTISLSANRPLFRDVRLACSARGSLLFGDGSSRMVAGEDLNLTASSSTTRTTDRDDLLPIGEASFGVEWMSPKRRGRWQWLLTSSLEGQIWGNAGTATSETGDLGFFGFNVGAGWLR